MNCFLWYQVIISLSVQFLNCLVLPPGDDHFPCCCKQFSTKFFKDGKSLVHFNRSPFSRRYCHSELSSSSGYDSVSLSPEPGESRPSAMLACAHKLQRIQISAARRICGLPRFSHISPTLFSLHWLPVSYRVDFKVLLLAFKAVYGLAPPYICDLVKRKAPSRYILRSDDALMLKQPSGKTRKTLGDRAFTVSAPALWNKLPDTLRNIRELNSFKAN